MADQMINQLPVTTAPKTGDKLLVIGAAEEQLIDYDKLADAILTKLTSKTFALEQGNKSLVAALNELNSKKDLYIGFGRTKLKENDDLDTYHTEGCYISHQGGITSTLKNSPVTTGHIMLNVINDGAYKERHLQVLHHINRADSVQVIYIRYFFNGEKWTKWCKFEGTVIEQ